MSTEIDTDAYLISKRAAAKIMDTSFDTVQKWIRAGYLTEYHVPMLKQTKLRADEVRALAIPASVALTVKRRA